MKKKVYLAIIGAAHGIKGDAVVKVLSSNPESLKSYSVFYDETERSYEVVSFRMQKNNAIIHFKGIEGRSAAESLRGIKLYVERNQLADDLDEDEFYQIDLIGLCVYNCAKQFLGKVSGFFNFGAGDLIEIQLVSGKKILISFSKAAVPEICVASGFLIVDPIAAGLFHDQE
ncbi:ribosome maturation factor RimM [Bartonella sp. Raccoon60]|uniref:ribosome maturation factor RimM n=1 Tax=Bartonella sp. Raccoon60 TaxID=1933912 RepID=UPI00099A412A|nr:ribosome maturation factor RimM [Bartonella sp. Raccoon60]AQX27239.1 16S rRNA processing protein RimM [Bartonella sp. Raccoon60]